jgi:glycosyltransferase involved in cell wall biosynthesis
MLSVVVLTFNSGRTVGGCLDSLGAQDPRPTEVLVVDDDSTDDTLVEVAAARARTGLETRVLRNGTRNISTGRNIGLDAARERYVAFLDSDAYAEPGWTAAIIAAFERDPTVAVVGGEVLGAHSSAFAEAVAVNDAAVRELLWKGVVLVSTCNMAVRTDLLQGEKFDATWVYAEDLEFMHRVGRARGWRVEPAARVRHESRPSPRTYLTQMYRYGQWKTRYGMHAGDLAMQDFVPTLVLLGSAALAVTTSPWLLLALPALSAAETCFVAAYRGAPPRLWSRMLAGWLVKNTGWGCGVAHAIAGRALTASAGRLRGRAD